MTTISVPTEYHAHDKTLATRAEMDAGFAEVNRRMDARFSEVNGRFDAIERRMDTIDRRMDALYRIGLVVALAAIGTLATAIVALVKFMFFGI